MKTTIRFTSVLLGSLLASAVFPGCNDAHSQGASRAHGATTAAEEKTASTFKAGHGLQLTPEASRFIGLQTAEFKAARLPATALVRTAKGDFVYVENGGWLLRTTVVARGTANTGFEIKTGLYEGDVVVTSGTRHLWLAELAAINGGIACADHH